MNMRIPVTFVTMLCLPVLYMNCTAMQSNTGLLVSSSSAPSASENGFIEFQKAFYPYARANCASCHGTFQVPKFADPDPKVAYNFALGVLDVNDVQASALMTRVQDGHCGTACQTDGSQLLTILKAWADAEIAARGPVPIPAPPPASFSPFGTAGLKNFKQYPNSLLTLLGKTATGSDVYYNSYKYLEIRLSGDSDPLSVNSAMLRTYTSVSTFFCRGFVDDEKARAAGSRVILSGVNFSAGPSVMSAATRQKMIQDFGLLLWKRMPTANEELIMTTLLNDLTTGVPDTAAQTYTMVIGLCTAAASSLDAIRL